jgi:putative DNA primase/helicase
VPMKADLIIERLEHVRATGKNRWIARCPAHKDSSPSLVITQPDNERVLIHCHAGCSTGDILDSLGLDWGALMPDKDSSYSATRITRKDEPIVDQMLIEISQAMFLRGERLSEMDKQAVLNARLRVLKNRG